MSNKPTEQSFLKDVERHHISIIRDDGIYRHIRFKRPDSGTFYFDLITWPGHLCFTGDMDTFVFTRIDDMFEFFRIDERDWSYKKDGISTNPGYWSEKLIASPRNGYEQFDEDKFERTLKESIIQWMKDHRDTTTKDERRELWDEFNWIVIGADGDNDGIRKTTATYDFHHRVNSRIEFSFADCWQYDFTAYTYHYIWACYAIVWGISQYDKEKSLSMICN